MYISHTQYLELSTDGPISSADRQAAELRDLNDCSRECLISKIEYLYALRTRLNEWIAKNDAGRVTYWRNALSVARQDWMRRNALRRSSTFESGRI